MTDTGALHSHAAWQREVDVARRAIQRAIAEARAAGASLSAIHFILCDEGGLVLVEKRRGGDAPAPKADLFEGVG